MLSLATDRPLKRPRAGSPGLQRASLPGLSRLEPQGPQVGSDLSIEDKFCGISRPGEFEAHDTHGLALGFKSSEPLHNDAHRGLRVLVHIAAGDAHALVIVQVHMVVMKNHL